jgi:hypothetical protein
MALVGPRPETEEYVLRWKQVVPEYDRRFSVLPGLTGLAQVSGYSDVEPRGIARRAQYDLFYVDHRSLLLDVRTLACAMTLMMRGEPVSGIGPVAPAINGTVHALPTPASSNGQATGGAPVFRVAQTKVKGVTQ